MKPTTSERDDLLRRIQAAHRGAGLSYADIARATGLDPSQVSRICRGHFRTFGGAVMQICTSLGVSMEMSGPASARVCSADLDPAWSGLNRAVRKAWDQTPEGAAKLARVIAAVAEVSRR